MHLKRKQYEHTKHQTKYIHDMFWEHEAGKSHKAKKVVKGGYELPDPDKMIKKRLKNDLKTKL